MNVRQKVVVWIGLAVIVLMWIVAPWRWDLYPEGSMMRMTQYKYASIRPENYEMDLGRLLVQ